MKLKEVGVFWGESGPERKLKSLCHYILKVEDISSQKILFFLLK